MPLQVDTHFNTNTHDRTHAHTHAHTQVHTVHVPLAFCFFADALGSGTGESIEFIT